MMAPISAAAQAAGLEMTVAALEMAVASMTGMGAVGVLRAVGRLMVMAVA